jgi:hypothetical protein
MGFRDRKSSVPLEEKIKKNMWDSIDDFLDVLTMAREGKWRWAMNPKFKYVNIRVDMRDGGCLILDDNDKRVDPKDLLFQYGKKDKE